MSAFLDRSKTSARFKPLFDFLREHEVVPFVLNKVTYFEFVGYSRSKKAYDELGNWLENQFEKSFLKPEDFDFATKISSMYKCKNPSINPRQISFVDCLYAAQLIRYKESAFIVTTDLNDYPSFLFNMPEHFAIPESDGSTSFVGFKTYSDTKLKTLEKSFDKSG